MKWNFFFLVVVVVVVSEVIGTETCTDEEAKLELERIHGVSLFFCD